MDFNSCKAFFQGYRFRYNTLKDEVSRLTEKYKGHEIVKITENQFRIDLMNVYIRNGKDVELIREPRREIKVNRGDNYGLV